MEKSDIVWTVSFHDEFEAEFGVLSQDVQDELLASALAVERLGPNADRPTVGTVSNPKHPNMKELRFTSNNGAEVWRAAFAFDPTRCAIILVAADKQGVDEKKFYRDLLKKANKRFDSHLQNLQRLEASKPRPTGAKTGRGSSRSKK